MSLSSRILLNHNLKRYFGKTSGNFAKYAGREARFFKKMVQGDIGKRFLSSFRYQLVKQIRKWSFSDLRKHSRKFIHNILDLRLLFILVEHHIGLAN